MPASLTTLIDLRSRLAEDLLAYLDALVEDLSTLPAYTTIPQRTRLSMASRVCCAGLRKTVSFDERRGSASSWRT